MKRALFPSMQWESMSLFTKHYVKHKLPPKQEKQPYDIKLVIIATTVFVILKASVFLHRNQGDLWVWRIIYTMWFTIMFLWVEAHCRGHKLSARYSTNHLGEGLRQEPIVTLAGCHLIQVSKWTENMALWEQLSHEKLHGAVGQRHSVDVALSGLESLAAGVWVRCMRWGTAPEPNSDYSPPTPFVITEITILT